MVKYAEKKDKSRIKECFQSIPKQLSKENKKFQYSVVKNCLLYTSFPNFLLRPVYFSAPFASFSGETSTNRLGIHLPGNSRRGLEFKK